MNTNLQVDPAVDTADTGQGLADEPRTWWFTFPAGHAFADRYAVTYGTHEAARAAVVAHFGQTFAGQFASEEEAGVRQRGLLRLRSDQWPVAAVSEQVLGEPAAAPAVGGVEVKHEIVRAWKGGPGECGVQCACDLTFDGFDDLAQPTEHMNRHIAKANAELAALAVDEQPAAAVSLEETPAAGGPESRRLPAAELEPGMYVATGEPEMPGWEVRHVERAEDGGDLVGVVFTGPYYVEYDATELLELVDEQLVEQARARARARARRAQQIEGLRQLADLAERDEFVPLPPFTLRIHAGLDSTAAVRRLAAALDLPVTEDRYGARADWRYGGTEPCPAVHLEASAPHGPSAGKSGRASVPALPAAPASAGTVDPAGDEQPGGDR
ncbi:hypothetical protein CSH63_27275 [Micromonospora tulbaghiae]|uniref:Uncharacterized protein n=1 Tax=Micromonospora tulbaghiae TaxID=479978 RepID=A0A386WXG0_9ACTN|nr:hypothetical protein [Micromonospora tulbaghiae]AYF31074.1 hypothetical protein CSH63_27275 [Micromonospora tulbaghiae]